MKRLLNSTVALSVALMNFHPWPLVAQTLTDVGTVIAADGTVLCEPSADVVCDPLNEDLIAGASKIQAAMDEAAAAVATAEAQANADAEAAAAADAQAKADAEAAAAVEADAEAKADADAAAAETDAQAKADAEAPAAVEAEAAAAAAADVQAKADAEAAAAVETDAQAKADAEAAAVEADAQAKADAEAAAAAAVEADAQAKAEAEAAAAVETDAQAKAEAEAAAAVETDAQAKADAEAAAAAVEADVQAKADAEAAAAAVEADVQAKADAEAAAVEPVAEAAEPTAEAVEEAAAEDAEARANAEAELAVQADGTVIDPAAGLKTAVETIDPAAVPVEAPIVSEEEIQTLTDLLTGGAEAAADQAVTAPTIAAVDAGPQPADAAPSAEAVTATSEVITEAQTRSATQEFAAAPAMVAPGKKNKLSDLEKAGLVVLGALVVGSVLNQSKAAADAGQAQQQVVSNTGDRVVVLKPDGSYQVFKDDDALLRRPGNTLRTETFKDGSTRTFVDRPDGSQIVTIRDATGRVLRRAHYDDQGVERMLINDLEPERPIVVSALPKPRGRPVVISGRDGDVAMKAALAQRQIEKIGRTFSLRQVRTIPQVRYLAAMIDVSPITFVSGSSALSTTEVNALSDLGSVMQDLLDANSNEVFLVEGHTDATGKTAMNLALSDRRAETVALALTEYFDIPPENMVVQGYGETELLIDTQADEKRNRRVGVRIITPLL
jgi:outer membrane protein OmpA-like peptidoglycan-associated protein